MVVPVMLDRLSARKLVDVGLVFDRGVYPVYKVHNAEGDQYPVTDKSGDFLDAFDLFR